MFVLEGDGPDPWTANFTYKAMLDTFDQFAIDGTYFHHDDEMYHIYSCWEDTYSAWPANLCITKFLNPWTISANQTIKHDRTIISRPDQPYEQVPAGRVGRLATNEGPQQLVNPHTGQNFVIYSAARVNTPYYCLAALELVGDDPMDAESWLKHDEKGCIFGQNPDAGVYATGHASFTTSPDGEEEYVVYHAQTVAYPTSMFPSSLSALLVCFINEVRV
jgi:GH43 family beta-xylosidase